EHCPVCESQTMIKQENGVKSLYCANDDCQAKHIKSFTHFVSRDAMGIDGLSEATIEKLIGKGLIKEYADIFHIERFKDDIVTMEGFGEKSFKNLIDSVNKARKTNPVRLLYSLGIPNVGLSNAKNICKNFNYQWTDIQSATSEQLIQINGVGDVMANAYIKYFQDEKNQVIIQDLLREIEFEAQTSSESAGDMIFDGLVFVITGSVEHFKNRNEIKDTIEAKGGKVTDSVTSKTNYLINNDNLSGSTKNKKAKELGVSIITEQQLLDWIDHSAKPE
ncbi:MAG: helix-hairpin-helix domain-containing protein, partial [Bacillota bacterium]